MGVTDPLPEPPDGVYPSQILFARRESGYPGDGTVDDYVEALARSLVSANRLYHACVKALLMRDKGDLVDQLELFEFTVTDHGNTGGIDVVDTRAILRLFRLHCMPVELQAELLNLSIIEVEEAYSSGSLGLARYAAGPEILWWQAQGLHPQGIADKIGKSKQFVYEVLNKSGIPPNRIGRIEPTKREVFEEEIIRLWNRGYTAGHIEKLLDNELSADYIRQIIARARKRGKKVRTGLARPAPDQAPKRKRKEAAT